MFSGKANEILYLRQLADNRYTKKEYGEQLKNDVEVLKRKMDGMQGGVEFETDETLLLENGILRVNTAEDAEQNNTLPITSAAVFAEIGNINTLLATI